MEEGDGGLLDVESYDVDLNVEEGDGADSETEELVGFWRGVWGGGVLDVFWEGGNGACPCGNEFVWF